MRILISIISTFTIFLAPRLVLAEEGQMKCIGCMPISTANANQDPNQDQTATEQLSRQETAETARLTARRRQAGIITAQRLDYWGIGRACSKFADGNGFGPYAQVIFNTISRKTHPALFDGTNDIKSLCKSFGSFDEQQREEFFAYLTAHLAFAESSCDPTESAPGPNGTAQGLLALHKNMEPDYTAKEFFNNKCKVGDSKTAERSIRCGMAMLDGQFEAKEQLFSRTGYWGPFTPQTMKRVTVQFRDPKRQNRRLPSRTMNVNAFIKAAIKMYPYCSGYK